MEVVEDINVSAGSRYGRNSDIDRSTPPFPSAAISSDGILPEPVSHRATDEIVINWYHVIVTCTTVGLGTLKAIASFRGQNILSNIFDIIIGIALPILYESNPRILFYF